MARGKIRKTLNSFEFSVFVAERMRLERTMPCGTPHFQCGSLPLEYLSVWRLIIIANTFRKSKREISIF